MVLSGTADVVQPLLTDACAFYEFATGINRGEV
jgi:hypothetical protein